MVLSRFSVSKGKVADNRHMPSMKTRPGSVTPLLRVVLIFGNLIIMRVETETVGGLLLFQKEAFFF